MGAREPAFDGQEHRATQLLQRVAAGESELSGELFELVHGELHRLAGALMSRERRNHTLQTTALVNEAWLRIAPGPGAPIECRDHFLRLASRAMHAALIDHARRRNAEKRGGGHRIELLAEEPAQDGSGPEPLELIALDEALSRLADHDEELGQIVEMRFFGGLTADEVARALNKTRRQIEGSWAFARGWLRRELARDGADD